MLNNSTINNYELGNLASKSAQASIGFIGIISNTLAFFVLGRKQFKNHSYSIYWRAKACFDNVLLLHTFRHLVRHLFKLDIDLLSPFFCRFNEYQPYVAAGVSLWLEFLITLDRFLTIVYPNRFNLIKQKRFQIAAISLILVYSLLVCINLPLNYRLDVINGTKICHVRIKVWALNWAICLVNILIVNLILNPILDLNIICHIVASRENVRPLLNRSAIMDRQFALSAIGINVTSLVFKTPFLVGNLLVVYFNLTRDQAEMVFVICLTFGLLEKADLLVVNVVVNSVFRREFLSMIGLMKKSLNKESNFRTTEAIGLLF